MESNKSTAALILARLPGAGRVVYGGQEPQGEALARSYLYWRKLGRPVSRAIELAESDCVKGERRWPSQAPAGLASYQNKPNDKGGRWIEAPNLAGLRFVGFADEVIKNRGGYRMDHTGYFSDDCQDSTMRGAVYQLPADREGRPRYVPGYREGSEGRRGWTDQSGQDGAAVIFLAEIELGEPGGEDSPCAGYSQAAIDCARRADRLAELAAEESREWSEASSAGCQYADKLEEAAEERRAFLALRAEIKGEAARPDGSAVCQAIRASLAEHVRTWRKRKAEAFELRDNWLIAWRGELRGAFAESAGLDLESCK